MRLLWVLFKKNCEPSSSRRPAADVVLALVMGVSGYSFRAALSILERGPSEGSIVQWMFQPNWFWLSYFFVFPLLTMRLFAEEETAPSSNGSHHARAYLGRWVLLKYLAAVVVYSVLWLPSYFNFHLVDWITAGQIEIPPGSLQGSYIILPAMGLFNLSIGCFASALTSKIIIAAVISFTATCCISWAGLHHGRRRKVSETFVDIISYFASMEHIRTFTSGLIDTRPIVYYTSLALLFLALTHQVPVPSLEALIRIRLSSTPPRFIPLN